MKLSDLTEKHSLDDLDADKVYDVFKSSYEASTGAAWSKDKFISRARVWTFYGDENGYVACRVQRSGMKKLVGVAGNLKSILKGLDELLAEGGPIWGAVSADIAKMAKKKGFIVPHMIMGGPTFLKMLVKTIPPEVFGGYEPEMTPDGGMKIAYDDVGEATKYLIGNKEYFMSAIKLPHVKDALGNVPGVGTVLKMMGLVEESHVLREYKTIEVEVGSKTKTLVRVYENPSPDLLASLAEKRTLRGVTSGRGIFVWNAEEAIHFEIKPALGLEGGIHFYVGMDPFTDEDGNDVEEVVIYPDYNIKKDALEASEAMRRYVNAGFRFTEFMDLSEAAVLTEYKIEKVNIGDRHGSVEIDCIVDPSPAMLLNWAQRSDNQMRGLLVGNRAYFWDGYFAIHSDIATALDVDWNHNELTIRNAKNGITIFATDLSRAQSNPAVRRLSNDPRVNLEQDARTINEKRALKEYKTFKVDTSTYTIQVYDTPSPETLKKLIDGDRYNSLRGLLDGDRVLWWSSEDQIHENMAYLLGIEYVTDKDKIYAVRSNRIKGTRYEIYGWKLQTDHPVIKRYLDGGFTPL